MRCYKVLLFFNLFVTVNPFMIRPSTSKHNTIQITSSFTNNLKKISSLNVPKLSMITNKCKKEDNDGKKELFIANLICYIIQYTLIYSIINYYLFHIFQK